MCLKETKNIILLTDFGTSPYVAQVKAVINNISPCSNIMDLYHSVGPQSVEEAAFILANTYRFFAAGSIFLCIVDPGVGSDRDIILIETDSYFFIAPDNGLLTEALNDFKDCKIYKVENTDFFLPDISSVFHGRDIFAPVAAHLAKGSSASAFGPEIDDYKHRLFEKPDIGSDSIEGKVIFKDNFGNLITNIRSDILSKKLEEYTEVSITAGDLHINKIYNYYGEAQAEKLQAFISSFGYLELSVPYGNAGDMFPDITSVRIDFFK